MKKLSLADVFNALIKVVPGFKLAPRNVDGRVLPTEQFAEGVIHYGSRAAYLEPTPKRTRRLPLADPRNGRLMYDANGNVVYGQFPVPEPWKRVTPRAVKPGKKRRAWLAEQRANA